MSILEDNCLVRGRPWKRGYDIADISLCCKEHGEQHRWECQRRMLDAVLIGRLDHMVPEGLEPDLKVLYLYSTPTNLRTYATIQHTRTHFISSWNVVPGPIPHRIGMVVRSTVPGTNAFGTQREKMLSDTPRCRVEQSLDSPSSSGPQ